jgi:plastocyanin
MTRFLTLLIACLALGLVVAGCGGDDDGGGSASTTEQPASTTGGGGAPKSAEVSMKDISFQPETVTVAKGGTVTWKNDDSVGHDVTADGFKSGDPGDMGGGDTYKHTFKQSGTFDYVCSAHPGMEGKVEVK